MYQRAVFAEYADRWEKQFASWFNFVRAVAGKVQFKRWVKATKKQLVADGIAVDSATNIWTGSS